MTTDQSPMADLMRADGKVLADGCLIGGLVSRTCEHGWRIPYFAPGGSIRGGYVQLYPGAEIRALPEGGFVIGEPCPQCPPVAP